VDAQGLAVHPAQVHVKTVVRDRVVLDALDNVHLDVIPVVVEDANLVVLVVVPRQVVLAVVVETAHQTVDTPVDLIVKVSVPVHVKKIVEPLALLDAPLLVRMTAILVALVQLRVLLL
jgi:hypothetical protein